MLVLERNEDGDTTTWKWALERAEGETEPIQRSRHDKISER